MTKGKQLELRHYAAEPFGLDRSRQYEQKFADKPSGLWVSVPGPDDWVKFCRNESFREEKLAVQHKVVLSAKSSILFVENPKDIESFTEEYRCPAYSPTYPGSRLNNWAIDWPRIAKRYDGIIITPYQWAYRLNPNMMWYYGWDCASGCIWNLDAAIESMGVVIPQVDSATGAQ